MKKIKIGINGFGRIGRTLFRLLINHPSIEVVAINDLAPAKTLAHLLKYDSIHGVLDTDVIGLDHAIMIAKKTVPVFNEAAIESISWQDTGAEIIIEATGKFKRKSMLSLHLKDQVKRVILAAPLAVWQRPRSNPPLKASTETPTSPSPDQEPDAEQSLCAQTKAWGKSAK